MSIEDIIVALLALADTQNIRERAREGCNEWLYGNNRTREELEGWSAEELVQRFASCSLVFDHNLLKYQYIDTKIDLFVSDYTGLYIGNLRPIGHYRLITLLDGQICDDYFVIDTPKDIE